MGVGEQCVSMDEIAREDYKHAFDAFTGKDKDTVSAQEMQYLLHGLRHEDDERYQILRKKEGYEFTLQEFMDVVEEFEGTRSIPVHGIGVMAKIFSVFDRNNDGFISPLELKGILDSLGCHLDDKELQAMVAVADKDQDGWISFDDYKSLFGELDNQIASDVDGTRLFEVGKA